MYYVYVIKSENDIYIGYSSNLKSRVAHHNTGDGAKTTKGKNWILVYYEAFLSRKDAIEREKKLKYHGQAKRRLMERISDSLHL